MIPLLTRFMQSEQKKSKHILFRYGFLYLKEELFDPYQILQPQMNTTIGDIMPFLYI